MPNIQKKSTRCSRRPYSRQGCQECKSRKLKCDESKPICWHCSRLNKVCEYRKNNIRFSDSRSFTTETILSKPSATIQHAVVSLASPVVHNPNVPAPLEKPPTISTFQAFKPPPPTPSRPLPLITRKVKPPSNPAEQPAEQPQSTDDYEITEINHSPGPYTDDAPNFNFFPLSPLINSLVPPPNDLTNNEFNTLATLANNPFDPLSLQYAHKETHPSPPSDSNNYHDIVQYTPSVSSPSSSPSQYFPLLTTLPLYTLTAQESRYFDIFYHKTSFHIMPFSMANSNPVRDSILSMAFQHKYLFSAVMATSSRTAFRISNDDGDDFESCKYLSKTLNSLSAVLSSSLEVSSSFSFEAVLTTVLILCTDHTSSHNLGWRAHLRGAKDLLDRGVELAKVQQERRLPLNVSLNARIMAFCKVWFAALEVVASITSYRGGTISGGFANHEAFADIGVNELYSAGIIKPNGFNLFLGYSTSCLSIFSELARLLKISRSPEGLSYNENSDIEKLISDIHATKQIAFPDADIELDEIMVFDDARDTSIAAEDVPLLGDSAWFCVSHKAHCEAAMLAVYTSLLKLPSTSPIVSASLSTLMALLSRIPYKDIRGTMIHWPLLTAGIHATSSAREKFVLDRLNLLTQNGVWSAEFSKKRVRDRSKEVERFTKLRTEEECDELDTVPF